MAYAERDAFDAEIKKLENTCAKNNLVLAGIRKQYPFQVVIEPDMGMDAQISMLDNPVRHNGKNNYITFQFVDNDWVEDYNFTGKSQLIKKLRGQTEKVFTAWIKMFFRETQEKLHILEMTEQQEMADMNAPEADGEVLDAAFAEGAEALEDLAELAEAGDAAETEE